VSHRKLHTCAFPPHARKFSHFIVTAPFSPPSVIPAVSDGDRHAVKFKEVIADSALFSKKSAESKV
jgi:hypothetical protein